MGFGTLFLEDILFSCLKKRDYPQKTPTKNSWQEYLDECRRVYNYNQEVELRKVLLVLVVLASIYFLLTEVIKF